MGICNTNAGKIAGLSDPESNFLFLPKYLSNPESSPAYNAIKGAIAKPKIGQSLGAFEAYSYILQKNEISKSLILRYLSKKLAVIYFIRSYKFPLLVSFV